MASLKEQAQNYEPPKTLTVADLEAVSVSQEIVDREGMDKEGKKFKYKAMEIDGEDYRVPNTVLEQIQSILEAKPNLKTVKVTKKGEGIQTKYTTVELE